MPAASSGTNESSRGSSRRVVRVILDSCVWGKSRDELSEAGHDVEWVGDWTHDPGDLEILDRSRRERAVLVTLDKDFGELAVIRGIRHSGIIRLIGFSARQQGSACRQILDRYGDELSEGALITVEPGRVRVRPA